MHIFIFAILQTSALKRSTAKIQMTCDPELESVDDSSDGDTNLNVSRLGHLLPKIKQLKTKLKGQEESGRKKVATLGNNQVKITNNSRPRDNTERNKKQYPIREIVVKDNVKEEKDDDEIVEKDNAVMRFETVPEYPEKLKVKSSHEKKAQVSVVKVKTEQNSRNLLTRQKEKHVTFEKKRVPPIMEEGKPPVHMSHVAVARSKAGGLLTRYRRRSTMFTATSEFMANINNLSHLTDQKIICILSQQEVRELEAFTVPVSANRMSPQMLNRASPWKLSTVLGAMRRPSKEHQFDVNSKPTFAQKREEIIAQQDIKDPLLQMVCKTSVCLPPVSEGYLFQPVDRNWVAEDVVFPEHGTESPSQEEWMQLRYCRYLRGRPVKHK